MRNETRELSEMRNETRELSAEELDAVIGGAIDGYMIFVGQQGPVGESQK
jgi:hypothetical protein